MKAIMERTRNGLATAAGLSAKVIQTEKNILRAAESRLENVESEIKKLTASIDIDQSMESEYFLSLIDERGQLNLIISRSRNFLEDNNG